MALLWENLFMVNFIILHVNCALVYQFFTPQIFPQYTDILHVPGIIIVTLIMANAFGLGCYFL